MADNTQIGNPIKISELDEAQAMPSGSYLVVDDGVITKKISAETSANYFTPENVLRKTNVVNDTVTTTTDLPLSANMGKSLQDEINNLKNIGRFLSIWNCSTGLPTTNPTKLPYTYKTGDYYRVGAVGDTNYKPTGSSYTGSASTTVETEDIEVGCVYYYDGTNWLQQASGGAGTVVDVQVNGSSVVSTDTGIANVVKGDDIYVSDGVTASATINADLLQGHDSSYFQQKLVSGTNIATVNGQSLLQATDILSNVDNTADLDKPISTATQNALDTLTTEVNSVKSGTMVINGTTVTFTITES